MQCSKGFTYVRTDKHACVRTGTHIQVRVASLRGQRVATAAATCREVQEVYGTSLDTEPCKPGRQTGTPYESWTFKITAPRVRAKYWHTGARAGGHQAPWSGVPLAWMFRRDLYRHVPRLSPG